MQLIEELETWKRGIYSGAIGYITETGDFSFNVVIRSAVIRNGTLTYGVGGAITSDSEPEAEWEETLIKARALVHAIPHLKV
jgi:para-aminobenzoate synthetase component 1